MATSDKIMSPKAPSVKGGIRYSGSMAKIKGQTGTQFIPFNKGKGK